MAQDDTLYRELILDLYKHPLHKKRLEHFDVFHTEHNPLCGDTVELFLAFDETEKISDIGWEGDGCAISQAAASLVTDWIKKKHKNEIASLTAERVLDMIGLPDLNPTRLRCALLALTGTRKALDYPLTGILK